MADRVYTRHPGHESAGGGYADTPRGEGDPLAELARLIGQNDPMADAARDDHAPLSPRHQAEPQPPRWVQQQRGTGWRKTTPVPPEMAERLDSRLPRHDDGHFHDQYREPAFDDPYASQADLYGHDDHRDHHGHDEGRYDDALYGPADPAQVDDAPYLAEGAYRDDYDDGYGYDDADTQDEAPRRTKLAVLAILALAVVGTGGAYAYRSLSGWGGTPSEPPVIKADTAPIKVVPPTQDAERKLAQDRLASAGGIERLVPREEAPVDVASRTQEPRIVFPPLTAANAPATVPAASAASQAPAGAGGPEPRKIRTVAVRPDQPAAPPATAPAAEPARAAAAPTSLAPDSQTRTASINPTADTPAAGGGYLVQLSSQRSEADARASYRILQGKFPSVLGNQSPVIRRADLGAKGVHYRAMVGPFASQDQAARFCGNLKDAGGQCFVQRN